MFKSYNFRQNAILDFIENYPGVASSAIVSHIARILPGKASRPTVLRDIELLLTDGAITKSGLGRSTRYYAPSAIKHGGKSYQEKDRMLVNVLDESGNITDLKKTKAQVHAEHLWHQEVAVFIINNRGQILLQKRSNNVHFKKGKYGMVANHVGAGQTLVDALLIKACEEIGVELNKNDIRFLTMLRRDEEQEKRITYFYYAKLDIKDKDLRLDPFLASGYKWFDFDELQELMLTDDSSVVFRNTPEYIKIFGELSKIVRRGKTTARKKGKEFILIEAQDGVFLPGVIHHAKKPTKRVAIHIHGTGGNFFKTDYLADIAAELNYRGIDFISVDNRGREQAAIIYKKSGGKSERVISGAIYENFDESIYDVLGAAEYAKAEGYTDICLIGQSLGTVKIMHYVLTYGDVKNIILAAPVDMVSRFRARVGGEFDALLAKAARNVKNGKPDELITPEFSSLKCATTFRYNCNADLFRLEKHRDAKLLSFDGNVGIIIGMKDHTLEKDWSADHLKGRFKQIFKNADPEFKFIDNADHMFKGYEKQLARAIAECIAVFS